MITNPTICCIIVTFNGERYIAKCLNNLKKSLEEDQIIIVDNASSDNTLRIIETDFSAVTLIKLSHNHGFGRANNIGLKEAMKREAKFILLINQDVYVLDQAVDILTGIAEANPQFAIISPVHLNGAGRALDMNFANYVSPVLISDYYFNTIKELYPCIFVNAAAWLLSGKAIRKIGGFDPLFFQYGEDNDFVNRVRYHGMRVGVCTKAQIIHDRGGPALVKYKESERKYLSTLMTLTNINYTFRKALKQAYVTLVSEMVAKLIVFNFKSFFAITYVSVKTLFHLNKIRKHRAESKRETAFLK